MGHWCITIPTPWGVALSNAWQKVNYKSDVLASHTLVMPLFLLKIKIKSSNRFPGINLEMFFARGHLWEKKIWIFELGCVRKWIYVLFHTFVTKNKNNLGLQRRCTLVRQLLSRLAVSEPVFRHVVALFAHYVVRSSTRM